MLGVVGGWVAGPTVGRLLFGAKFDLGRSDVALLATGSGLFIVSLTMSQALIALSGHAFTMYAWLVGLVTFIATTAVISHAAVPAGRARFDRRRAGQPGHDGDLLHAARPQGRRTRTSSRVLIEQLGYEQLEI